MNGIYFITAMSAAMGVNRLKKRRHAWEEDGGKPSLTAIRVGIQDVGGGMIAARAQEEDPSIAVLAASIAKHGLLQPVVVRGDGQTGRYTLVCGARRVLACRMLGMKQIDALLFEGGAQEAAACFMEEHATRVPAHFLDEAQMLRHLGAERIQACCALPPGEIARRLRMLEMDENTLSEIRRGALSLEQAEPLLCVADGRRRQEAASIIAQRDLTPRQARRLIMPPATREQEQEKRPRTGKRRAIREAMEAADRLAQQLNAQGIAAAVSMHSQERGLSIQILVKNPEISMTMQEKMENSANYT